ncbi:TPA_asm: RNA-directed RNA polymerase [ssRNA phage SRR5466727_1]|uniref:RNA-directed RNA polymerase n=1 Tax=ssRNA phage SRR5466727_1 TaxID=2786429 RepID=A0A8S5L0J7_9VIRU|nr:RNA-directed RNA polymerase [ssRNA phage SRR5466727_1]DAD50853.1 TPA_asm: RNA-directed RNA polymerase [ssRNA phage SRR5466727_1]
MIKAGWLDRWSYKDSVLLLKTLAYPHAQQAGRFSKTLIDLLDRSDWAGLLAFGVDYRSDDSPDHLYHARQTLGFFQKFEPLRVDGSESKERVAFRKFAQTEEVCNLVNKRFCNYRLGTPMGYPYDTILVTAREIIAKVLGECPKIADLDLSFGPGATVTTTKREACPRFKLGASPECSTELLPFVSKLMTEVPGYTLQHASAVGLDFADVYVRAVPGKLQFVPKDAKKYRSIVVEPGLNVLLQQGIGKWIRKRLKKAGIDLSDQTRNQPLAKIGSESNLLATIDFSSASDTIARQVVAFLLPDAWSALLSIAVTRVVTYEGVAFRLEKFSSMGNSFTFELESLIFWALAKATMQHLSRNGVRFARNELSIFGDDLIVPVEAVSLCTLVFAYCGFSINADKSYSDGPFRESCGADFFKGINIRPYYQKSLVSAESLFTLHNFYMRTFQFTEAERVRQYVHPSLAIFGPDGFGDGHLIGDWDPLTRATVKVAGARKKDVRKARPQDLGWEGYLFKSYTHVAAEDLRRNSGDDLLPAYAIYKRGDGDEGEPTSVSAVTSRGTWCDPKYLTVPGSVGYKEVLIYTRHRGIFLP